MADETERPPPPPDTMFPTEVAMGMTDDAGALALLLHTGSEGQGKLLFKSRFVEVGRGWDSDDGVREAKSGFFKALKLGAVGVGGLVALHTGLFIPVGLAAGAYSVLNRHREKARNKLGAARLPNDAPDCGGETVEQRVPATEKSALPHACVAKLDTVCSVVLSVTTRAKEVVIFFGDEEHHNTLIPKHEVTLDFHHGKCSLNRHGHHKVSEPFTFDEAEDPEDLAAMPPQVFQQYMAEKKRRQTEEAAAGLPPEHKTTIWISVAEQKVIIGNGCVVGQHVIIDTPSKHVHQLKQLFFQSDAAASTWKITPQDKLTVAQLRQTLEEEAERLEGVAFVQNLMRTNSGQLHCLRGEEYVHHVEYEKEFRDHFFLVVITTGHIVVLRRSSVIGSIAKSFRPHHGLRICGILKLSNVAMAEEFPQPMKNRIVSLRAVDGSHLEVPVLHGPAGEDMLESLLWALGQVDHMFASRAQYIPFVLHFGKLTLEDDLEEGLRRCSLHREFNVMAMDDEDQQFEGMSIIDSKESIVHLDIKCKNLKLPHCGYAIAPVVDVYRFKDERWVYVGSTETFLGTLSPDFKTPVTIARKQPDLNPTLQFMVRIVDSLGTAVDDSGSPVLGKAKISLADILISPEHGVTATVVAEKFKEKRGEITVSVVGRDISQIEPSAANVLAKLDEFMRDTHLGHKDQQQIMELFLPLGDAALKDVLLSLRSTKKIFERCDHIRAQLYEYFGVTRLATLTLNNKLMIFTGALKGADDNDGRPQFFYNIFKSLQGRDLYTFKDALDVSDAQRNLSSIVFGHITDERMQGDLLAYFEEQAQVMLQPGVERPLRLLSDIDDTLVHSGYGLGGPKLPKGTIMPGVVALISNLNARSAFCTARPEFTEHFTYRTLRQHYGIPGAVVLSGQLVDSLLVPFAPNLSNEWISKRKLTNICNYMRVFPDCKFLWFGDSGQGDIIVGQTLLEEDAKRENRLMSGVFIQDVVEADGIKFKTNTEERDKLRQSDIYLCDNYLQVACELYDKQLLSDKGLYHVAVTVAQQIRQLMPKFQDRAIAQARIHEFNRDLARLNEQLLGTPFHQEVDLHPASYMRLRAANEEQGQQDDDEDTVMI